VTAGLFGRSHAKIVGQVASTVWAFRGYFSLEVHFDIQKHYALSETIGPAHQY